MDVVQILEYMQSQNLIRLNKISGDYYSVYCPIHNNGNERRPSCGVLLHDQYRNGQRYPEGFVHCFTCGHAKTLKDTIEDILKVHPVDSSVRQQLKQMIGSDVNQSTGRMISDELAKSISAKFALKNVQNMMNKEPQYISEAELATYRYTVKYMYDRKLTDEIIERYDVGFDANYIPKGGKKKVPCITFPVRNLNGETLFIVRRAIEFKRFYMPDDIQKSVYGIYELPKNATSVYVFESCFNALTCVRYGKPAVALLGTGTPYQIDQLKRLGVREFILGFDPDEAGERATRKLKSALKDCAIVWSLKGIPEGQDMNDLTLEQFQNLELE